MNNKHRDEMDELKLAEQTARVLESGDCGDRDDAAKYELGRLLRQSADHELPKSSDALREQLLMELAGDGGAPMVAAKTPLKESTSKVSRKRMWMGVAAGAMVAAGGWWLYQPQPGFGVDLRGGMNMVGQLDPKEFPTAEIAVEPTAPAQDGKFDEFGLSLGIEGDAETVDKMSAALRSANENAFDKSKEANRIRGEAGSEIAFITNPRSERTKALAKANQSQRKVGMSSGLYDNSNEVLSRELSPHEKAGQGKAIRLPRLSTTTTNTVVSVPDGGTVLMGGRKFRMEEMGAARFKSGKGEGKGQRFQRFDKYYEDSDDLATNYFRFEVESNSEQYVPIHENAFVTASGGAAISTFSIDVDTASYANMRRFLNSGQKPPRDSIRIEELVNYFEYDYPQPQGDDPFSVNMELAGCPWNDAHKLLRVGLKGKEVHVDERPATNVVYLIDVSGSMNSEDKLPLLKRGFQMMTKQLGENDRVSIVTYAGNAGVALEPTTGDKTKTINDAIERLSPGGSTHGSAGIELAYKLAQQHFITGGVNKVILATDGDLNVGVTADGALVKLIKQKASEGVFLTVLGFGTGNLQDGKLEKLADNGNGHYCYLDSNREAHRVLVQQMSGSLVTIAKDVKIQIEFNPAEVKSYRLIGYENRMLATKDFDDDRKDAGEIGAGHTVTAIYEIQPVGGAAAAFTAPKGMKYQTAEESPAKSMMKMMKNLTGAAASGELATVALRYKKPDENTSKRIEFAITNDEKSFTSASDDFRFAASVAGFGMLLRGSEHAGTANPAMILEMASESTGDDSTGYRAEFIDLVRKAFSGQ